MAVGVRNRLARSLRTNTYFFLGSSAASPLERAAPAALLISTGSTAPFSNTSCTRTFPLVSEGAAPAAKQLSDGAAAPGNCSVLSSNAMATAGASSFAIASLVADFFARLVTGELERAPLEPGAAFFGPLDGVGAVREGFAIAWVLALKAFMIVAGATSPTAVRQRHDRLWPTSYPPAWLVPTRNLCPRIAISSDNRTLPLFC